MSQDLLSDRRACSAFCISLHNGQDPWHSAQPQCGEILRRPRGGGWKTLKGEGPPGYCRRKGSWPPHTGWGISLLKVSVPRCAGEGGLMTGCISLLLLTFNEIGNNKFVFPGVMVYISLLRSHFPLKRFQHFFMGRETRVGIPSQFLNHTDTSDFRGR